MQVEYIFILQKTEKFSFNFHIKIPRSFKNFYAKNKARSKIFHHFVINFIFYGFVEFINLLIF